MMLDEVVPVVPVVGAVASAGMTLRAAGLMVEGEGLDRASVHRACLAHFQARFFSRLCRLAKEVSSAHNRNTTAQ